MSQQFVIRFISFVGTDFGLKFRVDISHKFQKIWVRDFLIIPFVMFIFVARSVQGFQSFGFDFLRSVARS